VHGVAPSVARQDGVSLKAYHHISFKITIRGEAEMNYRIKKREAFRIVGVPYLCDDEGLRGRLETKLITKILTFTAV